MPQTVQEALSNAQLYSDEQLYRLIQFPSNAITIAAGIVAEAGIPFCALLADKDAVTLVLRDEVYQEFQKRFKLATVSNINYRLITFDIVLEPTLVGFMATITRALADGNISVLPFAAYSRDHLFVAEADFDKALGILKSIQ